MLSYHLSQTYVVVPSTTTLLIATSNSTQPHEQVAAVGVANAQMLRMHPVTIEKLFIFLPPSLMDSLPPPQTGTAREHGTQGLGGANEAKAAQAGRRVHERFAYPRRQRDKHESDGVAAFFLANQNRTGHLVYIDMRLSTGSTEEMLPLRVAPRVRLDLCSPGQCAAASRQCARHFSAPPSFNRLPENSKRGGAE